LAFPPATEVSYSLYPPEDPQYLLFEAPELPVSEETNIQLLEPDPIFLLKGDCIDEHFSEGIPCPSVSKSPFDVVWTWVNGSDKLFTESMSRASSALVAAQPSIYQPDAQSLYRQVYFYIQETNI